MIAAYRDAFNRAFTDERHRVFVEQLTRQCGVPIEFRLSETPCFFPSALIDELVEAARTMIDQLLTDQDYRRAADAIDYQFTVDDPTTWTRPWTAVIPIARTAGRIYEYACHEGNYGMKGILSGARFTEKQGAAK